MEKIKVTTTDQKVYIANIYLKNDNVAIELESDTGEDKYFNNFTLNQLIEIDRYFRQPENLESALNYLKDLFYGEYRVESNKENENMNIIFLTRRNNIKIPLMKIVDKVNISYDNLSEQMKEIIDDNQLVLGIDLGTTYSCAAVMIDNNMIMIRNSLGITTTPSYVSFINRNKVYVGELAKLLPSDEKNVIYNTKRLIGKNINDKEIVELSKSLPFKLIKDDKFNFLKILLDFNDVTEQEEEGKKSEEAFYPEQISSLILKKIIKDSEFYLSEKIGKEIKIKNAVITVPAYFNQKQREATLNSAKMMGLNVKRMINEPTAASLAYAQNSKENSEKNLVVIDFGGGTLDITLLKFKKDIDVIYCDIKFAYGNSYFGGEDFDNLLMDICLEKSAKTLNCESKVKNQIINTDNPRTIRLKRACERAKIKLSKFNSTNIHLENYSNYETINVSISRKDFDNYCAKLFKKFEKILGDFIKHSKVNKNNISEVILIGGSTLIPKIKEIITKTFDKSKIKCDLNPKEVVAMGAAIRGAKFNNLPSVKDIQLFDVTNLSLGIRIYENKFGKVIDRSKPIPFESQEDFFTVEDNQTNALIEVYEGESNYECDKNNLFLGKFMITDLPKGKKGEIKVIVKIKVNKDSLLEVIANYEKNNTIYDKKLLIERPKEILSIMDELRERYNEIEFYENEKYNNIKLSIINYEEEIRRQNSKKNVNYENLKSLSKKIIEYIGNFLMNDNNFSSLYISFIKYYFNKICEYYQTFIQNNIGGLDILNESILKLFDKLELKDSYIIFEIIEEFIDLDDIYKKFKDMILKNYWEKVNTLIYLTNSIMKDKLSNYYNNALKDLAEAKKIANVCKELLINNFINNQSNFAKIILNDIENIVLKIEVREELIKIRKKSSFKKFFFSENIEALSILHKKYINCPFLDIDDLNELGEIIGFVKNNDLNIEKNFKKASTFIQWLKKKKK